MADLNLGAKEFIPSWLKQPAARPAAPAPQAPVAKRPEAAPAPPNSPPSQIPWKAPPGPQASSNSAKPAQLPPRSAPPATAAPAVSHMNPNAVVFQPKFTQSPAALQPMPAPAAQQRPPLAPQAQQWPSAKKSPQLKSATPSLLLPPSSQPLSSKGSAAPVKVKRSDDEVLQISKLSNLKVGAAVFVPGQRSNARANVLGKPSPLTLTPASPDLEMMLFDTWSLYCLCNSVTKEENYDPTQVFRIDSVPTFWKVMNNLPEPTELAPPTTMYLFRDDINPKWEDKKNISGGTWRIRIQRDKVDAVWLILLCKTIGESWNKEFRNTVNGIVLKVREKGFNVEIWVTEKKDQFPSDLVSTFEEQMPAFTVDYYTHEQIQAAMSNKDVPKKGGKKVAKRK